LTAQAIDDNETTTTSTAVDVAVRSGDGGDDIVLYAAEAPVAANWSVVADATAAGGSRLQNPNAGAGKLAAASAAPTAYFELTFDARAGRGYHLWIRAQASSNDATNDSVFVQFDNSVDANGAPAYRIGTTNAVVYNLEECSG